MFPEPHLQHCRTLPLPELLPPLHFGQGAPTIRRIIKFVLPADIINNDLNKTECMNIAGCTISLLLSCIANLAMSEEVEDGTEVLGVTIYQECSALILDGLIVMWLQYVNWEHVVQIKDCNVKMIFS